MKINNLQHNFNNSFKRVIKVEYQQNPDLYRSKYTVKKGLDDLEKTLNYKPTIAYTKKEQKQLINFFKNFLEDPFKKSPLKIRHLPTVGYVLLTGEDAMAVQNWEKFQNEKDFIPKKNKKNIENEEKKLNQDFLQKIENGLDGKPKTTLKLYSSCETPTDKKNFAKIDSFEFYESEFFYTSIFDGHIFEKYGEKIRFNTYGPHDAIS